MPFNYIKNVEHRVYLGLELLMRIFFINIASWFLILPLGKRKNTEGKIFNVKRSDTDNDLSSTVMTMSRRRKLWQLEARFHCSVIGTCLSLKELRQIWRKIKCPMNTPNTDYDLHRAFVGIAGKASHTIILSACFISWVDFLLSCLANSSNPQSAQMCA